MTRRDCPPARAPRIDRTTQRVLLLVLAALAAAWLVDDGYVAAPHAGPWPGRQRQGAPARARGAAADAGGGGCQRVPKDVYLLWDAGFERAPDWERTVLWTWRRHNPDWTVHAMTMAEAIERADVFRYVSRDKWSGITTASRSDILRVLILARYGGVWADASLACNAPLTGGVLMDALAARGGDVLQFRRDDVTARSRGEAQKRIRNPRKRQAPWPYWVASWFIAAPGPGLAAGPAAADSDHRCSYAMWRLREETQAFWAEQDPEKFKYFWLHLMEARLIVEDERFAAAVSADTLPSADPSHCTKTWADGRRLFVNEDGKTINETVVAATPVFKRCNREAVSALYRSSCAPDCFEKTMERPKTSGFRSTGTTPVSQEEIDEAAAAGLRLCVEQRSGDDDEPWIRCA